MKQKISGVTTVEMAYIMPVVLFVFLVIIYSTFYFHDKIVLSGMSSETAMIGAQKERLPKGMEESELRTYFDQQASKKLILLSNASATISKNKDYIVVTAKASRKRMKLEVEMKALVMEPEKFIRMVRKLKGKNNENNDKTRFK